MSNTDERIIPLALPELLHRFSTFVGVYLLTGVVFLVWYRYQLNPDAVSYLDLAQGWATLDGRLIWNTYWSPLLPILTAPLLQFGLPGIIAAKLVSLLGGVLVLWVLWQMARLTALSALMRTAVMLGAGGLCIEASMRQTTPDVLAAGAVLLLLYLLVRPVRANWRRQGLYIALALALCYFAKLYLLYFAIVALPLVWLLRRRQLPGATQARFGRQIVVGYGVGVLLCGLWCVPLSVQQGAFTLGEAGSFNYALVMARGRQFPMATEGLMPPLPGHTSAWTDITQHHYPKTWPGSRTEWLAQQARVIGDNLVSFLKISGRQLYVLLLIPIGWLFWHQRGAMFRTPLGHLLLLCVVYVGGYLFVIVEQRYLLPAVMVALLLAAKGVQLYIDRELAHLPLVQLVPAALLLLAITDRPFQDLLEQRWAGRNDKTLATQIDRPSKGLATTRFADTHWHRGLYIAYWQNTRYFGSLQPGDAADGLTVLHFGPAPVDCPATHRCRQLDSLTIMQPREQP